LKLVSRKVAQSRGLSRYFSGILCRNGHNCERYTSSGGCVLCTTNAIRANGHVNVRPARDEIPAQRCARQITNGTDWSWMTEAQIQAWYEHVNRCRNEIRPLIRYRHHPLKER
jgi:hypothetical protein